MLDRVVNFCSILCEAKQRPRIPPDLPTCAHLRPLAPTHTRLFSTNLSLVHHLCSSTTFLAVVLLNIISYLLSQRLAMDLIGLKTASRCLFDRQKWPKTAKQNQRKPQFPHIALGPSCWLFECICGIKFVQNGRLETGPLLVVVGANTGSY